MKTRLCQPIISFFGQSSLPLDVSAAVVLFFFFVNFFYNTNLRFISTCTVLEMILRDRDREQETERNLEGHSEKKVKPRLMDNPHARNKLKQLCLIALSDSFPLLEEHRIPHTDLFEGSRRRLRCWMVRVANQRS